MAVDGVAELVHELVLHPGDVPLLHLARELAGAGVPAADHPRAREAVAVAPPLDAAGDPPQKPQGTLRKIVFRRRSLLDDRSRQRLIARPARRRRVRVRGCWGSFIPGGPRRGRGGGRPGGGDGRWAEAEVAERPPERAVGDGRWAAGAAGARNESG